MKNYSVSPINKFEPFKEKSQGPDFTVPGLEFASNQIKTKILTKWSAKTCFLKKPPKKPDSVFNSCCLINLQALSYLRCQEKNGHQHPLKKNYHKGVTEFISCSSFHQIITSYVVLNDKNRVSIFRGLSPYYHFTPLRLFTSRSSIHHLQNRATKNVSELPFFSPLLCLSVNLLKTKFQPFSSKQNFRTDFIIGYQRYQRSINSFYISYTNKQKREKAWSTLQTVGLYQNNQNFRFRLGSKFNAKNVRNFYYNTIARSRTTSAPLNLFQPNPQLPVSDFKNGQLAYASKPLWQTKWLDQQTRKWASYPITFSAFGIKIENFWEKWVLSSMQSIEAPLTGLANKEKLNNPLTHRLPFWLNKKEFYSYPFHNQPLYPFKLNKLGQIEPFPEFYADADAVFPQKSENYTIGTGKPGQTSRQRIKVGSAPVAALTLSSKNHETTTSKGPVTKMGKQNTWSKSGAEKFSLLEKEKSHHTSKDKFQVSFGEGQDNLPKMTETDIIKRTALLKFLQILDGFNTPMSFSSSRSNSRFFFKMSETLFKTVHDLDYLKTPSLSRPRTPPFLHKLKIHNPHHLLRNNFLTVVNPDNKALTTKLYFSEPWGKPANQHNTFELNFIRFPYGFLSKSTSKKMDSLPALQIYKPFKFNWNSLFSRKHTSKQINGQRKVKALTRKLNGKKSAEKSSTTFTFGNRYFYHFARFDWQSGVKWESYLKIAGKPIDSVQAGSLVSSVRSLEGGECNSFSPLNTLNLLCVWPSYIDDILGSSHIDDSAGSLLLPNYFQLVGSGPKLKRGITVIASTNNLTRLDAALLRPGRFDTIINFVNSSQPNSISAKTPLVENKREGDGDQPFRYQKTSGTGLYQSLKTKNPENGYFNPLFNLLISSQQASMPDRPWSHLGGLRPVNLSSTEMGSILPSLWRPYYWRNWLVNHQHPQRVAIKKFIDVSIFVQCKLCWQPVGQHASVHVEKPYLALANNLYPQLQDRQFFNSNQSGKLFSLFHYLTSRSSILYGYTIYRVTFMQRWLNNLGHSVFFFVVRKLLLGSLFHHISQLSKTIKFIAKWSEQRASSSNYHHQRSCLDKEQRSRTVSPLLIRTNTEKMARHTSLYTSGDRQRQIRLNYPSSTKPTPLFLKSHRKSLFGVGAFDFSKHRIELSEKGPKAPLLYPVNAKIIQNQEIVYTNSTPSTLSKFKTPPSITTLPRLLHSYGYFTVNREETEKRTENLAREMGSYLYNSHGPMFACRAKIITIGVQEYNSVESRNNFINNHHTIKNKVTTHNILLTKYKQIYKSKKKLEPAKYFGPHEIMPTHETQLTDKGPTSIRKMCRLEWSFCLLLLYARWDQAYGGPSWFLKKFPLQKITLNTIKIFTPYKSLIFSYLLSSQTRKELRYRDLTRLPAFASTDTSKEKSKTKPFGKGSTQDKFIFLGADFSGKNFEILIYNKLKKLLINF